MTILPPRLHLYRVGDTLIVACNRDFARKYYAHLYGEPVPPVTLLKIDGPQVLVGPEPLPGRKESFTSLFVTPITDFRSKFL